MTALRLGILFSAIGVHAAVQSLMAADGIGEDEAYSQLRREAMRQRVTLEQQVASVLARPRTQAG